MVCWQSRAEPDRPDDDATARAPVARAVAVTVPALVAIIAIVVVAVTHVFVIVPMLHHLTAFAMNDVLDVAVALHARLS